MRTTTDQSDMLRDKSHHMFMDSNEPTLIAYSINRWMPMRLVRAPSTRAWMESTGARFANRCLPLLIANQSGWFILNSHKLCVVWNGGDDTASVKVEYLKGAPPYPALSHFGYGILTWNLPYLFRTSPGFNLLVRGPANSPKDGAYPLEGVVEADWCLATFTMNWKLTHPNHPVTFEVDEPICMLVPQRRGEIEGFQPIIQDIASEPEIFRGYQKWCQSREQFLADLKLPGTEAVKRGWQKDYFQGITIDSVPVTQHETKLTLRDFVESNEPEQTESQRDNLLGTQVSSLNQPEDQSELKLRDFYVSRKPGFARSFLSFMLITLPIVASRLADQIISMWRTIKRRRTLSQG